MILKFQKYNVNEQIRISKSIISWINNYSKTGFSDEDNLKVKQIIYVDFGLSITPEMVRLRKCNIEVLSRSSI